ncbi:hypothetical protein LCGC14_0550530 [marine sediment metagenome]|uniref:Uncharacterized protein n=1 Tax=marine sediment metagenome TaxID=412755 RepID=A0A0F9UY99_9ZZZZ
MAERMNTARFADDTADEVDFASLVPRYAPLDMPRQVLEREQGPSVAAVLARLFLRNA